MSSVVVERRGSITNGRIGINRETLHVTPWSAPVQEIFDTLNPGDSNKGKYVVYRHRATGHRIHKLTFIPDDHTWFAVFFNEATRRLSFLHSDGAEKQKQVDQVEWIAKAPDGERALIQGKRGPFTTELFIDRKGFTWSVEWPTPPPDLEE